MANITESFIVLKVYESFILGKCRCGCGVDIPIRNTNKIIGIYKQGHWRKNRFGKDAPGYKTGRYKLNNYWVLSGYYGHPNANKNGKIFEHILIMSNYLGRPLKKGEIVHHIEPVTPEYCNNDISNLQLVDRSNHNKIHHPKIDKSGRFCIDCGLKVTYYHEKTDHFHWHGSDIKGWRCNKCYFKILNKKRREYKREWNRKNRIKKQPVV